MRALAAAVSVPPPSHFPPYPLRPFFSRSPTVAGSNFSLPLLPKSTRSQLSSPPRPPRSRRRSTLLPRRSGGDPAPLYDSGGGGDFDDDDEDFYLFAGDDLEGETGSGITIEVQKLGSNSRRIRSKIGIEASLDAIWSILTDYERLSDFIPGLAVSKLIEKKDNFARLYQIGEQKLPLGLKFNAKAVLDCYEKELERLSAGKKRDIEFKMTEGDFQFFEGKWSIEQVKKQSPEKELDSSQSQDFETTLSYFVDIKPKLWLPVHLIEGRICREIKKNLTSIKEEAQKFTQ
ncbi:unnamed protein product [Linum tenue]|uniref:Coenzyme Q-binding protein COQ10 START domain-containing protein n=2 Tax=Linum tenue TaxID=586396 RepID=A0AAV0PH20_9ROSI|nr:unnamed protein product [Linum tenue]